MTGSDVVFDTWAWWEVLHGTATGKRLQATFLGKGKVHSPVMVLAELSCNLQDLGRSDETPAVIRRVASAGRLLTLTDTVAVQAGGIRAQLRKRHPDAGVADALMLAAARSLGLRLVSGDAAFKGQPDVIH